MGCSCGKNRAAAAMSARGVAYVYDFTPPGGDEPTTFGTALEAKREVRKYGGGSIRRREVSQPAA